MSIAIFVVCLAIVCGAGMAWSDYANSAPYTGPWAFRVTNLNTGALEVVNRPMYNFTRSGEVVPMHNFFVSKETQVPLHNPFRGVYSGYGQFNS